MGSEYTKFGDYKSDWRTVKVKCEICKETYCEVDGKLWSVWGNVYANKGYCKECAGYGKFQKHSGDGGGSPWRNKKG